MGPIIFIHKGSTDYLFYTLDCARFFNPDARVVMIGNKENEYLKRRDVEFVHLEDLEYGDLLKEFDTHYQYISSPKMAGRDEWDRICTKRWLYLYNFVKAENLERFWFSDSDVLVTCNLAERENRFAGYDCTKQCRGHCIKGLFNNSNVLERFVKKINEVYQRKEFLEERKAYFAEQDDGCFNEMSLSGLLLKEEPGIKTFNSQEIVDGETFDDAICLPEEMEPNQHGTKRLYIAGPEVFTKHLPTNQYIKNCILNMSWVNTFFIAQVFHALMVKSTEERFANPVVVDIPRS